MTHDQKLRAAIEWMGERYVLHPKNRVVKGDYEHPVQRVNIAETFARLREKSVIEVTK